MSLLPETTSSFAAPAGRKQDRRIIVAAAFAGVLLTLIGVRFLIWPESAARFFGLSSRPNGLQLHAVISLRDLWLGLLAVAFCWFGEWRALTLWLGLGALVCFGDAGIVAGAQGKPLAVAFHVVSGMFCGVLAVLAWRRTLRDQRHHPGHNLGPDGGLR